MASEAQLFARLADAFGDAARANERIAQAFAQLAETRPAAAAPTAPAPQAAAKPPRPAPVLQLPTQDDEEDDDTELKPASLRILAALAGSADPLNRAQICIRSGLAYKSSTTDRAFAELRAGGFISTSGHANGITEIGAGVHFPELPKGYALFEYWLEYVGGKDKAPGKVLVGLRDALRDHVTKLNRDQLCDHAGLEYKSSTTDRALAMLRRLELMQTTGHQNELHEDLKEALVPTIGVHNTRTGNSVRVKAR
jgi:hypothetical protein